MDALALIGAFSVLAAGLCVGIGAIGSAIGEGNAAASAIKAMAQQPDEASKITRTMLMSMAIIESTAIYALVIAFIILFGNPFWNYFIDAVSK